MLLTSAVARDPAREADIDAYLTKPVRRASLLETIAEVLAGGHGPHPAAEPEPDAVEVPVAADGRRVLVAEDNPVNQLVIQGMLAKRGFEADVVTSGRARSPSSTASATSPC